MCKKNRFIFVLAAALFAVSPAFSQKDFKPFGHLGLGVKVSTAGYGLEVATPFNKLLILRLGVNMFNDIKIGEWNVLLPDNKGDFVESFGYVPELRIKPGVNFANGNLLLDFHPAGIFHLTAGVFVGKSMFKVDGRLVDRHNQNSVLLPGKTWPVVEVNDEQEINFTNGRTYVDLQLGNTLKPYFGLGLGRAVPKSRLSFKFEIGALYQKGYSLRQNEMVFDLEASGEPEVKNIHDNVMKYGAFWPMINFQLSCRIF